MATTSLQRATEHKNVDHAELKVQQRTIDQERVDEGDIVVGLTPRSRCFGWLREKQEKKLQLPSQNDRVIKRRKPSDQARKQSRSLIIHLSFRFVWSCKHTDSHITKRMAMSCFLDRKATTGAGRKMDIWQTGEMRGWYDTQLAWCTRVKIVCGVQSNDRESELSTLIYIAPYSLFREHSRGLFSSLFYFFFICSFYIFSKEVQYVSWVLYA